MDAIFSPIKGVNMTSFAVILGGLSSVLKVVQHFLPQPKGLLDRASDGIGVLHNDLDGGIRAIHTDMVRAVNGIDGRIALAVEGAHEDLKTISSQLHKDLGVLAARIDARAGDVGTRLGDLVKRIDAYAVSAGSAVHTDMRAVFKDLQGRVDAIGPKLEQAAMCMYSDWERRFELFICLATLATSSWVLIKLNSSNNDTVANQSVIYSLSHNSMALCALVLAGCATYRGFRLYTLKNEVGSLKEQHKREIDVLKEKNLKDWQEEVKKIENKFEKMNQFYEERIKEKVEEKEREIVALKLNFSELDHRKTQENLQEIHLLERQWKERFVAENVERNCTMMKMRELEYMLRMMTCESEKLKHENEELRRHDWPSRSRPPCLPVRSPYSREDSSSKHTQTPNDLLRPGMRAQRPSPPIGYTSERRRDESFQRPLPP